MNASTRQAPVHLPPLWKDGRSPLIFLTVCTLKRCKILASDFAQQTLEYLWSQNQNPTAWSVGKYVLMPDHTHLFCAPGLQSAPLESWVKFWKSRFTQKWKEAEFYLPEANLWQKNFWDMQIRSENHYSAQWEYVLQNPVRADLAKDPSGWKFKGEIDRLEF